MTYETELIFYSGKDALEMKRILKETCGCESGIRVIHTVQKKLKLTGTILALKKLAGSESNDEEIREAKRHLDYLCHKTEREIQHIYTSFETGASFGLPQLRRKVSWLDQIHYVTRLYVSILLDNQAVSHDEETDTYTLLEKIPIEDLVITARIRYAPEITEGTAEGIKVIPVMKFSHDFVLTAGGELLRLSEEKLESLLEDFRDADSLASDAEKILETHKLKRMLAETIIAVIKDGSDRFEDIRERMEEKSAELFGMELRLPTDELLEFLDDMERVQFIESNDQVFRVKREMTE